VRGFQKKSKMGDNERMNQPTDPENLPAEQPQPAPAQPVPQAAPMPDPRRRLRELLSIPESQRTDPQWDEIIELEVQLAPGNRIGQEGQGGGNKRPQGHSNPSGNKGGGGGGGGGGGPGGGGNFKRHGPRKFQKPKKPPQV
jgi:uncharacterized membrane protein YgcG